MRSSWLSSPRWRGSIRCGSGSARADAGVYRSERQAEALAAYQDARRALVDELGIEPGRALRELERSILMHDPSLDFAPLQEPQHEAAPAAAKPTHEPVQGESHRVPDVRKTVTVVAVEITTSSARAEGLDPETLRRIAGRTFAEVKAAAERHGGTIEIAWGMPSPSSSGCRSCTRMTPCEGCEPRWERAMPCSRSPPSSPARPRSRSTAASA